MEQIIAIKPEFNSLEKIENYINTQTDFNAKQDYDSWEIRRNEKGEMKKCVVIKKSNFHGAKLHFIENNLLKINYIIPNKLANAYLGKNPKKYQSIIEIVTGKIKDAILAGPQKKAFGEIIEPFTKIKEI